jgi:seryl-tRNA synthetase
MHDIKFIRENPAAFDAGLAKRGLPAQSAGILKLDEEKRTRQKDIDALLAERNQFAKKIGMAKVKGENVDAVMAESKALNDRIVKLQNELEFDSHLDPLRITVGSTNSLESLLASLPNIPADDVPVGADETGNKQVREHGSKPTLAFIPKEHFELGEKLRLMDFERAAKMSGARFVVLKGQLARLERAIAAFMLDLHTQQFGYMEVSPPLMVRDNALYGTGQLPKFGEDLFKTTTDHYLIPTAEVSLTNLVNDEIIAEDALPMRMTAHTPCFRSEAGSAGRDTKGMIRQHQFSKVELVSITHPDKSAEEHERMTACAEEVLKRLGLHYRVMLLCTGDMGFGARKTYDIEVWLPGQNMYREISSCSNCGDFQARRMKARFKPKEGKGNQFVHTLNGSGLAVGRTMVAILENYQQADGSIKVPDALVPYMGGVEIIKA